MTDATVTQGRPPASDWTNDWDHLDPRWRNNPYPIWDELRGKCPIAHTGSLHGRLSADAL